jgi:hypothetical protein
MYNDENNQPPLPTSFAVARLDNYATRMTMGVAYLGGVLMLPLLFAYLSNTRWGGLLVPVSLAITLALFLLLTYAFQPVNYQFEEEQLVVRRRLLWALKVPLENITAGSPAPQLARIPREGLRFGFNPGIFGYQGPFYLAPYGRAFFMATSREHMVSLARTTGTPLILSPARPQIFLAALQKRLDERAQEAAERAAAERERQQ